MKEGKLTENVWKRSVLKQIKTKRKEVLIGAGTGENCAVFSLGDGGLTAVSVNTGHWPGRDTARYALHGSLNALAALGAEPVAVEVSVLLPQEAEESQIRAMAAQMEEECASVGVQITEYRVEITEAVNRPIITITGIGRLPEGKEISIKRIKPGMDIVVSKWIGLEGTVCLAKNKEKELLARYPARFLEEVKRFDRFLSVLPEAATAIKSGVCAMYSVAEGGIFGALWEMAAGAGVGLETDLKRIPVRQETIEICEFFELNPYELVSGGCLLMVADKGYDLVRELEEEHIPAAVIGKTTGDNDRIVINKEERRFLEPRKPDEIYKIKGYVRNELCREGGMEEA